MLGQLSNYFISTSECTPADSCKFIIFVSHSCLCQLMSTPVKQPGFSLFLEIDLIDISECNIVEQKILKNILDFIYYQINPSHKLLGIDVQ